MNIPIANIADTSVDTAIILNDISYNTSHINTEAKQIINQRAFLEVTQLPCDNTEVTIIRRYNNNNEILLSNIRTDTTSSTELNDSDDINTYEIRLIIYFFILFIFMIFILNLNNTS